MSTDVTPIHGGAVAAVVALLDSQRLLSLAVNRPDGWPQVTTVGYVNDGLNLYFTIGRDSQKLANIKADPRVSVAVRSEMDHGAAVGLSMAGRATEVLDPALIEGINRLVSTRYPDVRVYCPDDDAVAVIHMAPEIISPVAVMDGRSRPQTFSVGPAATVAADIPGDVSRLF
ncbi:pyridoxamine 5'-phosphate oxidase family protein [uncultured Brevundimonas sp.]|uniref:pyridoxamine 5'-phosphate oxidase family protein n=1 Tax=uncultured Brevundimonas sp. TaxID=213418 RepID=UPI0030ED5602|tara:strand:+ start:83745 stop:84260 length:516 start_codon:yes stop_codon:yes gene_type:complete